MYKLLLSGVLFLNGALTARYFQDPGNRYQFQSAQVNANAGMTYVGGFTGYYAYALPKRPEYTLRIVQMGNLFVALMSLFIWLIAMAVHTWVFPHTTVKPWMTSLWWTAVCLPFYLIFGYASRLLQGLNEMTWLNRANMFQPLLFFVIYIPIFFDQHLSEASRVTVTYSIWTGTFGVSAIAALVIAYRFLGLPGIWQWRFSREHWQGTIGYGGLLSISNLVNYVNLRLDFWLIAILGVSSRLNAQYGVAITASEVLLNISQSVAQVVFTRMVGGSREDAIHITEVSSRQTMLSSGIVAIGMFVTFPFIMYVAFGARYAGSIVPFLILLPGLVMRAAGNIIIQYFQNQLGNVRATISMNAVTVIFKGVFCLALVPWMGIVGAAIASSVAYFLSYLVYVWQFARVNHVSATGLVVIRKSDFTPYFDLVRKATHRITRRSA
jgi:O-antigen/teichoic acid export membrane protein